MSRATCQTTVLLGVYAGCLSLLKDEHVFSRVDMQDKLDAAIGLGMDTMTTWPNYGGNPYKETEWRSTKFREWQDFLSTYPGSFGTHMLLAMANRITHDLYQRTNNKQLRQEIENLLNPAQEFYEFFDPNWRHFIAQQECKDVMNKLYAIIDFRWE